VVKNSYRHLIFLMSLLFAGREGYCQGFGIHLDRNIYISGDALRFKIYYLDQLDRIPGLLYVRLLNAKQFTLDRQLLKLDSLGAEGCIYLPSELETGRYVLHFYLVWDSRSGKEPKFESGFLPVDVYNDFEEEITDLGRPGPTFVSDGREIYARVKRRSRVQLDLNTVSNPAGGIFQNGSVSVFQYLPGSPDPTRLMQFNRSPDINPGIDELRTEPVLEGQLIDPVDQSLVSEKYLSLFVPHLGSFQRFSADSGRFKLKLPAFEGVQAVQALSLNPNQSRPLEIKPDDFNPALPLNTIEGFPVPAPSVQAYLQLNYKRRIVHDFYKIPGEQAGPPVESFKSLVPDRVYQLKDFQQIHTVGDFIREVMLDARSSAVMDDRNKLRLRNRIKKELFRWPAWIMVDGLFAGKESAVFEQEVSQVNSIGIFNKESTILSQLDTLMKHSGLLAIQGAQLKDHAARYGCLALPVQGWSTGSPWIYRPPSDHREPDLRSLLYWDANVKANEDGQVRISFHTGDLTGLFEIKLVGYDRLHRLVSKTFLVEVE